MALTGVCFSLNIFYGRLFFFKRYNVYIHYTKTSTNQEKGLGTSCRNLDSAIPENKQ